MRFLFFIFFIFIIPFSSAYNCTALQGENHNVCNYIEGTNWPQTTKDNLIEELISNGGSLNGNFNSIKGSQQINVVQLNELQYEGLTISPKNKSLLIDISSLALMGYMLFSLIKRSKYILEIQ